uniref:RdRp n=1 Tax=viral metagenome TaxID=1070528 RepID=A0A2V0RGV6_9ZZZZ
MKNLTTSSGFTHYPLSKGEAIDSAYMIARATQHRLKAGYCVEKGICLLAARGHLSPLKATPEGEEVKIKSRGVWNIDLCNILLEMRFTSMFNGKIACNVPGVKRHFHIGEGEMQATQRVCEKPIYGLG